MIKSPPLMNTCAWPLAGIALHPLDFTPDLRLVH
jgi:hypothetical protein